MRYFFGFLAAVGLIVVVFILVLRGLGSDAPQAQINMLDYTDSDTVVQLTVDGPVDADQTHKSYRIVVGRDEATVETYQGYDFNRLQTKTYPNNEKAYAAFLRSLQLAGYTKGNADPAKADERGYCPEASRYIFEIITGGKKVQRFWTSDCGNGTFGGDSDITRDLFHRQIPDYRLILRGFTLS